MILIQIELSLYINLRRAYILIILTLPNKKHGMNFPFIQAYF